MLDQARLYAACRQLPQLLEPERVGLRVAVRIERELADQLLGQAATTAFGQHREARADFRSWGVVRHRSPVLLQSHVADLHAGHGAVGIE